jgi:hypothetical protein
MASPYIAGVAAILIESFPNYSPEQIKSLIVNSANSFDDVDRAAQGAGNVNQGKAISSELVFSPSIIYFGDINTDSETWSASKTLNIENKTDSPKTVSIDIIDEAIEGVEYSVSTSTLTIPSNSTVPVTVSLNLDHTSFDYIQHEHLAIAQRINVVDDKTDYQVPVAFAKMVSRPLDIDGNILHEISFYNKAQSHLFKNEEFSPSEFYAPMGIYGAFAKFSGPEFNTTLALTSTDNIDLTRQNQTAIEISADAAIHEVAINNITKSDGSPLVPSAPSGFFVEMSDADAKFFNLYDDIFGSTLDLTYMRLFVSSLPENIELRISGIVQEVDDITNPSRAEFLVFNDLMRGLNDSVSYEIDHSELALQTFTFLPQMIGEQQATLSPAATVYSRVRYEYSSNVFGPYDPRLSSFTSGKGIGSTIPDESGRRQNLDSSLELNLFVMPRKERNNQYLGLYDVYNWLRTDDDFVWQTYIE